MYFGANKRARLELADILGAVDDLQMACGIEECPASPVSPSHPGVLVWPGFSFL
jgi:hypothetical protein